MKKKSILITILIALLIAAGALVLSSDLWKKSSPQPPADEEQSSITEMAQDEESSEAVEDQTEQEPTIAQKEQTAETEETPPPHEHRYTETVVPATCTENGHTQYTCECGDNYTVEIEATGHTFEEYIYNNDATYLADGTQTATCSCGEQDTVTAEGSKLQYTFTALDKVMYTVEKSNLRTMPCNDGDKVAKINGRTAVAVTGVCNETGWYRINHNGQDVYTMASNLADELPELVYTNEYPMDEYGNRLDPYADGFDPYHRPGYVWIPGFGYIETGGTEGQIVDGGTEAFGGANFWDIINDPNNPQVGY